MKLATTIFLAIATLSLGLYAYLDHSGTLERLFGEAPPPLFEGPAVPAITSLTIADASETRSLEKRGERWHLTDPVDDVVDPAWIEKVLETFGSMHPKEFLPDKAGSAREGYGLSAERATPLTIGFAEGEPLVYQIGDPGPFEKSTFLYPGQRDAYEGAFVVAGDFRKIVEMPVVTMLDPVLARFTEDRVVGLTFKHKGEILDLKRSQSPGSRWRIEAPDQFQANDDAVSSLLSLFASVPVSEVVLTAGEPTAPTHTVQVWDVDPQNVFELGFRPHPTEDSLLRATHSKRPLEYDVPKTILDSFPKGPEALREYRLLRVAAADISSVTINALGNPTPLRLEHAGVWLLNNEVVNQEQGERFLALFNDTEVDIYLDGGADKESLYGFDQPLYSILFEGSNLGPLQGERCLVRVGMPPGSPQVFISVEGMTSFAAVPTNFYTGIARATEVLNWKKLEVLNVAFDRIREVTLASANEPSLRVEVDYKAENPDNRLRIFREDQDRTDDLDRHVVGQLIFSLGTLSADRWLPNATEALDALKAPSLIVSVTSEAETVKPGDERVTAKVRFAPISQTNPAFYYGQLEGDAKGEGASEPFLISSERYNQLAGKGILLEVK